MNRIGIRDRNWSRDRNGNMDWTRDGDENGVGWDGTTNGNGNRDEVGWNGSTNGNRGSRRDRIRERLWAEHGMRRETGTIGLKIRATRQSVSLAISGTGAVGENEVKS